MSASALAGTAGAATALPDRDAQSIRWWWLLTPALALYAVTFLVPVALLVALSLARFEASVTTFGFHPENYVKLFTDGITLPVFWTTVKLSLYVTTVCLLLGYPVAAFLRGSRARLRLLVLFVIVSPLLTSIIVRNVAWVLILGRSGIVNDWLMDWGLIERPLPLMYNEFGVVLAVSHVYLSFMVLPIFASLQAIPHAVEEGAASLGAPPLRVFLHVTLPMSLPGVAAGCTLVFILTMGIYVTPVVMGGNFVVTLPMMITDTVRSEYNWPQAAAMALMLLVAVLAMVVASSRLQRVRR